MNEVTKYVSMLKDKMTARRVPMDMQYKTLEVLLDFYKSQKPRRKQSSLEDAENIIGERMNAAYNKTLDYLKKKGY